MKIGILQLSDIHINSATNHWISEKADFIAKAVKGRFEDCGKLFIVVSGDIANSGNSEEYKLAKDFFKLLLRCLAGHFMGHIDIENKIICVPGNHDCDFSHENCLRKSFIKSNNFSDTGADDSIYKMLSEVQGNYVKFVNEVNLINNFSLAINNNISFDVGGKKIMFRLYNTSWMSSINEEQGSIVMPLHMIKDSVGNADLTVSVFHHYFDWFSADNDNNKCRFRSHVMATSNIMLYGHEHHTTSMSVKDNLDNENLIEFEGGALCAKDRGALTSAFNTFIVDLSEYVCNYASFIFENGMYRINKEHSLKINSERKTDIFRHNHDFLVSLQKMSTPIHNLENEDMLLNDFFVYPDVEKLNVKQVKVDENFIDSYSLLSNNNYHLVMLEGDDQSGKTSLLHMYYQQLVDSYKYPLFIKGKHIDNINIDKILRTPFKEQYSNRTEYERYSQFDNGKKVLLIDDFDECLLDDEQKKCLIEKMLTRFVHVFLTLKEEEYIPQSYYLMDKKDILITRIKPLGYVKRNELVKKFYTKYNGKQKSLKNQDLLEQTKNGLNTVQTFLGKEYMPSFPIYILSILLSSTRLRGGESYEQTSYGHCYDALITCALMTCVDKDNIDKYYNFLKALAYFFYGKGGKPISADELDMFYTGYSDRFFAPSLRDVKLNLLKCSLLKCSDDYYYKFSYNYIYYFLVANYMADEIHTKQGQDNVLDLCSNIHDEQKANILIFMAHHIKNPQFIDDTLLALMTSLDTVSPVTLQKDDSYYKLLDKLCESMKKEVIALDKKINPEVEREKMLEERDKHERNQNREADKIDLNEQPDEIINMAKALRSLEVVGQIVKNRQGSIEKTKLAEMIRSLYEAAFRTISYYGEIVKSERDNLMQALLKNKQEGDSDDVIKKKIETFFEVTSLNFCLFIFSKMISSVGNKDMRSVFSAVSQEMNTPAAKLVSFSIISCFSKLSVQELKALVDELKDNPVAISIIRARVRSYLYNNYVSYDDRQKIVAAVSLDPKDKDINTNIKNIKGFFRKQ